MTVQVASTPPGRAAVNPWLALTVVMTGTIMVVLDTTIVNVALHQIGLDLHAGNGIEWVVTAYLLAVSAAQPATGWLADRLGRKPVFLTSLAAFTLASVAAATSPNLGFLVLCRVLQGFGGGALLPVGMAMVLEAFPKSRHGRAVAVWGMAAMLGPAIGPTLGGWLVTSVSWHWLFLINAPLGVAGLVAGIRLLPNTGHRESRPFDAAGLLLGGGGLSVAVLGLSEANSWGWASAATVGCILGGVISLLAFVHHELRSPFPLIELRMFKQRMFRLAMGVMLFVTMAQYARLVFVPLELESLRGYTAFRVGMLFFPAAIVTAVTMSVGGLLVDQVGPRLPIMVGCVTMLVAMIAFSQLTLSTPMWLIAVLMALQGAGTGLISAPAMVAGLSDLPARLLAQGTAVRSLVSQVSGALAVAAFGAVVAIRMGRAPSPAHAQVAYNSAFVAAGIGVALSVVLAFRLRATARPLRGDTQAEGLALALE